MYLDHSYSQAPFEIMLLGSTPSIFITLQMIQIYTYQRSWMEKKNIHQENSRQILRTLKNWMLCKFILLNSVKTEVIVLGSKYMLDSWCIQHILSQLGCKKISSCILHFQAGLL